MSIEPKSMNMKLKGQFVLVKDNIHEEGWRRGLVDRGGQSMVQS